MIKCKNCGKIIDDSITSSSSEALRMKFKNEHSFIPQMLLDIYKDFNITNTCKHCLYPVDYKELPMEDFFRWLEYSSEHGDIRKDSFKAILRYFDAIK